jgi:acetyl esterase/lipase
MLVLILIGIALGLCAVAGTIYLRSPPNALDILDSLYPGDGGINRVGSAAFRPGEGGGLDIWAAKPVAGRPRPVLVFFYGGAWVKGRRQDYGFVGRAYAARGFVVVIADYRKVPGVRFPAFVEDGAAAVRWTRDHIADFGGDPNRIVLAGHSAGAYIAVLLALDHSYLTRAGVDPAIVRAAAGLAGPYDFYPFDSSRAVAAMGNAPDPRATQPISFARSDAPPLWLATGSADTEVKPRNAISLASGRASSVTAPRSWHYIRA